MRYLKTIVFSKEKCKARKMEDVGRSYAVTLYTVQAMAGLLPSDPRNPGWETLKLKERNREIQIARNTWS
jgi:hypothetical protein